MKVKGLLVFGILLLYAWNSSAQVLPHDSIPVFLADSLSSVYIYADTGTALNKIDAQGRRQGLWEKKYEDGNLRYRGHFWDNKPSGVFKNYYDEGDSLQSIRVYSNDGQSAYAHLFYTTGALWAEGKYVNEKRDSIWKFYDEVQRLVLKNQYKDGKREGKSVIFYKSGNTLEVKNWKNDMEEGPFQQYFDEGGLKEEGTYLHGKLVDTLYFYDMDGNINIKGKYENDLKEGNWIFYVNHEPKDTLIYHKGKCLNMAKFVPNKRQEDSLKMHYQQLQEKLDHPASLEDEYHMPGGE
jgi:antitoxin component YwqK of YwqJK toxin-antitoxin module